MRSAPSRPIDGPSIWVANNNDATASQLSNNGRVQDTPATGAGPFGVVFDGTYIWVSDSAAANVKKYHPVTGALIGTYATGIGPVGICCDGTNIWIVNNGGNTVTKLRASDGALQGTYAVGNTPYYCCFDGTNVWITNFVDSTVTVLNAVTGALVNTYATGPNPKGCCFDGTNVWILNNNFTMTVLRASDGVLMGTYPHLPSSAWEIAFDGIWIWVGGSLGQSVVKFKATSGGYAPFSDLFGAGCWVNAGTNTWGVCTDGVNVWLASYADGNVVKIQALDVTALATTAVGVHPLGICSTKRPSVPGPLYPATTKLCVFDGNSLTQGIDTSAPPPTGFGARCAALLGADWDTINNGIAGEQTPAMDVYAASYSDPYVSAVRHTKNIAHGWELTNHIITGGADAVTAYNAIVAYCNNRRAAGFAVAVGTCLSANVPGFDAIRNACNVLIRAGWAAFADALVDFAADPLIGYDGAWADMTYWAPGGIHLNDAGTQLAAQIAAPVILTM